MGKQGKVIADPRGGFSQRRTSVIRCLGDVVSGKYGDDEMFRRLKFAALAAVLATGAATGTAAYAQSTQGTPPESGAPGVGTMHGDGGMHGDMMQGGDMMNMMTQMNQMMETCNKMMQSAMMSPTNPERPGAPMHHENGG